MRLRFWRKTQPVSIAKDTYRMLTDPTISDDALVAYMQTVRSTLVCAKCGWNWSYHDDGNCVSPAQAKQIIEVDGR